MGRERNASKFNRSSSYKSPSRSPRQRERYSRTMSHSRGRSSVSQESTSRYEDNHGTMKPAYGGPKEPLVLDSNIQISVNSKRSCSPIRPTSATRIVTIRSRGEGRSHNTSAGDRGRYERDSKRRYDSIRNTSHRNNNARRENYRNVSRREREYESLSPNRRRFSPYRGRREDRKRSYENRNRRNETHRNGRYDHHERTRLRDGRRRNSSTDRRHESSSHSSRRNGYDEKLERNRNFSKRRRYSREDRLENGEHSNSSRRKSYDESDKSHHEEEPEGSENENEKEDQGVVMPNSVPIALGVRPPMWGPMVPLRPPILFPPRPPIIHPMGYVLPPRPRFFPFPRPPLEIGIKNVSLTISGSISKTRAPLTLP